MSLLLTAASYFVSGVVLYYTVLFGISLLRKAPDGRDVVTAFVVFVAAMNGRP